jgi:hypothetical protein
MHQGNAHTHGSLSRGHLSEFQILIIYTTRLVIKQQITPISLINNKVIFVGCQRIYHIRCNKENLAKTKEFR